MSLSKILCGLVMSTLVSGCATIIDGSEQSVTINTTPPGAQCDLSRNGTLVGTVGLTPGSLRFEKSKRDLTITCRKENFAEAKLSQPSSFVGTTFFNLILGGGIGFIVDASTGANFKYPEKVDIVLAPAEAKVPVAVLPSLEPVLVQSKPTS